MLLKGFARITGTQPCRDRDAACGVQRGTDHTAMQTPFAEVTNQLGPHGHAGRHMRRRHHIQLQAQQLVKNDFFFEQVFQAIDGVDMDVDVHFSGFIQRSK